MRDELGVVGGGVHGKGRDCGSWDERDIREERDFLFFIHLVIPSCEILHHRDSHSSFGNILPYSPVTPSVLHLNVKERRQARYLVVATGEEEKRVS
jgi:hypothetical protein